jgi:DNA-binding beta-propeller fold protein YncE
MREAWPNISSAILISFSALLLASQDASSAEPAGKATSAAAYRVFASHLDEPRGLLIAPNGLMYVAEQKSGTVARIGTDGKVQRIASGFHSPHDLDLDASGNLYVADTGAGRVAKIAPSGAVSTFIDDLESPVDLAFAPDGDLWVCELTGKVRAFRQQGGSRVVADLSGPHGLAFAKSGTIYINDWRGNRVVKLEGGRIGLLASLAGPVGVAIGPSGDIYVAQPQAHQVSRIKSNGTVSTFASGLNEPRDPVFDHKGNLYIAETLSGRILVFAGDF